MSDIYVVVHIATTCDESTTYVTKDSTELIEFAWSVVDATTLKNTYQESVLVRPINTPITQYCSQLHKITWEHVRNAGSFKDAIGKFDNFMQENVILKNKEFSLITFDVSKIRVQLPREARDKSVVLPPYLQHPRIFDIQNEYAKWQTSHPEALSYTASSLSNIITALEVEMDSTDGIETPVSSSSTPSPTAISSVSSASSASFFSEPLTNPNLNSYSNLNSNSNLNLSSGQETRTKSTINVYTNVLVQLVKKSLPVEEHPSVLTKPFDSAQDVKIFLVERSKILYLSNLPGDTTQSELESWFTQYGGRPIAFWTLKNVDANEKNGKNNNTNNNGNNGSNNYGGKVKGISGFAVFATHEEATESLSMNGRALNDMAVEVQASSTSVLDKARDLLTPFPPSKNRPRPGDWTCPSCGFSNFQRRTACFRCSFPAASAVTIQESMFSGNTTNSRRNNNSTNSMPNNNNSDKIALNAAVVNAAAAAAALNQNQSYNSNYQEHNFAPGSHKVGGNGINGSNNHQHANSHSHHSGHGHNHNNNSRPHYGNNVPFRAGDWKCSNESCQYHNFAKNLCCLKCGNAKHSGQSNHNSNNNNNNHIHSVNSTAAAIAAATASGQPLNLNNGFMGIQQPQPLHPNHYSPSQTPVQQNHNQHRHNSNVSGNNYYSNKSQFPLHLSNQNTNANLRGTNNTPPQLLAQQLAMLQQHQHQQHQQQNQKQASQPKYSQSVLNSPGMYSNFGPQQASYQPYSKNIPNPPHSAPVSAEATNTKNGNLENLNPSLNVLANQISSLNLNGNQQ